METINITISLMDARELHRILSGLREVEMNATGSFKIVKLLSRLDTHALEAENVRMDLIKNKWGVLTADNNAYNVPEDKMQEFTDELKAGLSKQVQIECPTFSESDFEGAKLSPNFFLVIAPLLK
jgi:hypothetical protein